MIREMIGEEIYYPADPLEVRAQMQRALRSSAATPGSAAVVACPFGAWSICLPYLADAMRSCSSRSPDRIIILAPPTSNGPLSLLLPESTAFATPFGQLPIAVDSVRQLTGSAPFAYGEIAHLGEHSIEVLLPALHYIFGPVPIVPLLVPWVGTDQLNQASRALKRLAAGGDTLVMVAANLSGFATPTEADARARKVVRLLMTSRGDEILANTAMFEDPPRSLAPLVLGHILAPSTARPTIMARGMFETEYHGDVGTVVFGSIAYIPE